MVINDSKFRCFFLSKTCKMAQLCNGNILHMYKANAATVNTFLESFVFYLFADLDE
jgi:hypothetical protein